MKKIVSVLLLVVLLASALPAWASGDAPVKVNALKWKEEVKLDFIRFSIDNCALYRSPLEVIDNYPNTFAALEDTKYFVMNGTVENPKKAALSFDNLFGQVTFDNGEAYPFEFKTLKENQMALDAELAGNASQKWFLIAQIPAELADTFKSAKVRVNFYDRLKKNAETDQDGDYFYSVNITEKKAASIQQTAEKKLVYFKEKSKLPRPESYVDVILNSKFEKKDENRTIIQCNYYYYAKYSDASITELVDAYIAALKQEGLSVKKTTTSIMTDYLVQSGKATLAHVIYSEGNPSVTITIKR
ncbi:MAG: hypothetical protein IJ662_12850 [Clostridia bacterium]|nr:hypothetical protein [Clostridia bacterium]